MTDIEELRASVLAAVAQPREPGDLLGQASASGLVMAFNDRVPEEFRIPLPVSGAGSVVEVDIYSCDFEAAGPGKVLVTFEVPDDGYRWGAGLYTLHRPPLPRQTDD